MKAAAFESIQYCKLGKENFILIFLFLPDKIIEYCCLLNTCLLLVYFISLCDLDIEILINTLPS